MTHMPETGTDKMESIHGAGFWSMCHGYLRYLSVSDYIIIYVCVCMIMSVCSHLDEVPRARSSSLSNTPVASHNLSDSTAPQLH